MTSNAQQIEYWNGEVGQRWVDNDAQLERMLAPVTAALLQPIDARAHRRALDVGCGCGNQTLALARHLGPGAWVTGIDISEPMLEVARGRSRGDVAAGSVEFLLADAASHAFTPASFDLLFSRFGVMFFSDPDAAFGNLRRALSDAGELVFCCWQPPARNTWFMVPMQAALRHVAPPPPVDPLAPGPFAFADIERVRGILERAGFSSVTGRSLETSLCIAEAPNLEAATRELVQVGPINSLLAAQEESVRAAALADIGAAVSDFYRDGRLLLPVAIWMLTAKA